MSKQAECVTLPFSHEEPGRLLAVQIGADQLNQTSWFLSWGAELRRTEAEQWGGWLFQGCGHCGFLLFCGCGECLKPQPLRCPVWMLCEYGTFGPLLPANQSLTAAAVRVWLALVAVSQTQNCFFSPPTFSSEDFCLKYYSLTLCRLTCLCKVEDKQICLSWRGAKGWVEKQGLTSILTDPPILKKAKV